jgi:transcriptional regulator with XRE-family HTH domain
MAASPVGLRIKKRRQVLRLTQADLAARLGVAKSTVANWETGKHYPARYLGVIEEALGVSLTDEPEPDPRLAEIRALKMDPADEAEFIAALEIVRRQHAGQKAG